VWVDSVATQAPARLRSLPSWLVNQAAIQAGRLVSREFDAVGVRRYHYSLMTALDELGPASQSALSRHTSIDRGDMVAAVNELADRAWVTRKPHPTDRRRNVIALTATGRRQLHKLDDRVASVQREFLAPLSAAERRELVRLLATVVDHGRSDQGASD
jgi:DNA-binding MarR family transcriptional regulator